MSIGTGEGGSWPRGPDEHPQDLLPLYALDLLEGREQRSVEAHVAKCTQCAETVRELRASLDSLSVAASPVSARDALFRRVRGRSRVGEDHSPVGSRQGRPWRSLGPTWAPAAGSAMSTALAAFVVVLGWQLVTARAELSQLRQERASPTQRTPLLALAEIGRHDTRIIPLQASDASRGASGLVFYEPEGRIAVAVIDDLPALEPGKVYQLWLLRDSSPVSGGTFQVNERGVGTIAVSAPNALDAYTRIGITAEPAPGVPSPTGEIVASASL